MAHETNMHALAFITFRIFSQLKIFRACYEADMVVETNQKSRIRPQYFAERLGDFYPLSEATGIHKCKGALLEGDES